MAPRGGPIAGGTVVTVVGTGLSTVTIVHFGTARAIPVLRTATYLRVRAPAHVAGTVLVTVTSPSGTSASTSVATYTYAARPTITKVSPAVGSRAGGTLITLTGTNFVGISSVKFGGVAGTIVRVSSTMKAMIVRTPRHAPGVVAVTVAGYGGTSASVPAARYSYR